MKSCLSVALAILLLPLASVEPAFAGDDEVKQAQFVERVRAGITQLGTGPEARVKLTLRDRTKLEGFVSPVSDTDFVVTDVAGNTTTVQYPDVTKVNGNNLRTRWKVVIAASIVAGIIITLYIVRGAFCDGC